MLCFANLLCKSWICKAQKICTEDLHSKARGGESLALERRTSLIYALLPLPTLFNFIMNSNDLQEIARADMVLANPILNVMQIGQIKKCVISSSSSSFVLDQKKLISTLSALELICGQKFQVTRAKQSIAAFKLREGVLIGCKSTLRKQTMSAFLEKCGTIVLPRMRSLPYTLHGQRGGGLNFSLLNLLLFPELENHFELFEGVTAINVNFTYQGNSKKESKKSSSFFSALQVARLPDKN